MCTKEGNGIGSESCAPSLSHLTDPICKPNIIVHTFTFHANCKIGSSDRLDMSRVAVLYEVGEWDRV